MPTDVYETTQESDNDIKVKIVAFINKNDVFWLMELRVHLGCLGSENNDANRVLKNVIIALKGKGLIQCSQKLKSERQYIAVRIIEIHDV